MPTTKKTKTIEVKANTVSNVNLDSVTEAPVVVESTTKKPNPKKTNSIVRLNQTGGVDLSQYSQEELQKYKQVAGSLDVKDNTSILNFGVDTQRKLASSSDMFLNNVRQFDAGEIGNSITDLLTELNYIEPDKLEQSGFRRIISQIPILRKLVMSTEKLFQKYDTIGNNVEKIATKLDKGRVAIIKDNNMLETLFEKNVEFIQELEGLIIGGSAKLQDLEDELANMEANSDQYEDYEIADLREFIDRLKKRLHDMALTRMITLQSLPQIRLVQNNNNTMVEKIQSSIMTTVPLWKNQLSIAVTLKRQEDIAKINDAVYKTTNEILTKNAERLRTNTVAIAQQNERGVVDIESLKKVQQELIQTITEVKQIKADGEAKRKLIAKELEKLENDLENEVLQLK